MAYLVTLRTSQETLVMKKYTNKDRCFRAKISFLRDIHLQQVATHCSASVSDV
jgi:hypothetical protein